MDKKVVESLLLLGKKSTMKHQKLFAIKLEDLPVEVLLKVFNFLELIDLYRCGQVSKRLKSVSLVESLWQKVILLNNTRPEKTTVAINLVEKMLERGCKTLCLKRCKITGGYLDRKEVKARSTLCYYHYKYGKKALKCRRRNSDGISCSMHESWAAKNKNHSCSDDCLLDDYLKIDEKTGSSQFINLDLYQCEFTKGSLETLLSSSHSLKKFSLTERNICLLDNDILHNFYSQNGQTLQTLNLAFTAVLDCYHIKLIVKNCIGLKEVDLSDCRISDYCIHLLVNGLTKNIEKVGLACSNSVTDASIGILVSRCNKIKSLNLAFNYITDNSLTSIKENLEYTLEELDVSGCQNIPHTKLLEMRSMQKLKVLNYFNPRDCNYEDEVVLLSYPKIIENDYEDLKRNLPQLTNNNPWEKWKAWHVGASLYFFERRKHLWEIRGRPGPNWV